MISYKGLTSSRVEESRRKNGSNQITPQKAETFWDKLKDNFKDPTIIILVVALVIVILLAIFGFAEWYEGVGIAAAVALATFVATISEHKNEQTFQKLQEEASKIFINTFRDGALKSIGIDDIVVGDIVLLQPGDKIPGDGKILKGKIKVNQAALTGEPEPVSKTPGESDVSRFDNPHTVFRGTIVEDGEAAMEVLVVGDNTQLGKLAKALQADEREGPLRVKLAKLAHGISVFGYIAAPLIAVAFMFKSIYMDNAGDAAAILAYVSNWQNLLYDIVIAFILAVIIIVVAVPEGLPMMIAIVLAQNMRKLLKSNVLVRQLMGVETSGSLNLLFTDKTGTITKGLLEMVGFLTVDKNNGSITTIQHDSFNKMPPESAHLLDISLRENTSCVINCNAPNENERILGGNSSERALLKFVNADIRECKDDTKNFEHIQQIHFNSIRKYSAVRLKMREGEEITLLKGAPEIILNQCSEYYTSTGDKARLLSDDTSIILKENDKKADEGFRLIALATTTASLPENPNHLPEQLCLLGLALIRDELRPEAKSAIETLQNAGIHVVMVTGDRSGTAKAIARDAGLLVSKDDIILESSEIANLPDDELKKIIPKLKVVSRCMPQDKTRLVKLAQEMDLVVAMTGDGVNDTPALSNSDIGFGLGSGTEVAKEASDIVVMDNNIQSITNAVYYGRTIYRSIQKFITFQLSVNVAAISIAFIGPFLGFELPLTMIQLLWINLIMDTLAALAFSGEPPLPYHMNEKPKRRDESIITNSMWSSILLNGIFMTIICIIFLKVESVKGLFVSKESFLTAFFGVFVFLNNFNKFNVRVGVDNFNIFHHITQNKGFLRVVGMIFVIQVVITYLGGDMFRTVALTPMEWVYVLAFSIVIIPFDMIRKSVCRMIGI